MGEIDFAGILVLKLLQAAARAAVAQAFPFDAGHLLQRLGFPEETLLAGGRLGLGGHESLGVSGRWLGPLLGAATAPAQARWSGAAEKAGTTLSLPAEIVSPTIG